MGLRFKAIAAEHAARPALAFAEGTSLSYAELDDLRDRVATHLLARGVSPGRVLAIQAEKHPLVYAAMLAALKIGAPYVALDTQSPHERTERILARCQPAWVLTEADLPELAKPAEPFAGTHEVTGSTPAYLMFTSGSTGFPKGVTIAHSSMLHFADWARETFAITPQDRLTGVNPLYFDNSVFDFTASLFNGACLVPIRREAVSQPKQLVEQVKDCTIWFSVPSLLIYIGTLRALAATSWPKMRAIIFGGEGFPKAELKKLHALYGQQATLWNVYGPTECTCICSAHAIGEADFEDMSKLATLGTLAPLFRGYVMNEAGTAETLKGEVGELWLAGPQLALGYYHDPERTEAAFVTQPQQGERCYRTGDFVRRDAAGNYHFAGRRDNQIKHMGYRIELEEIEAALTSLPGIAQAAAIYHKHPTHGGKILAFVSGGGEAEALKARLREILPSYMIPETLYLRETLPKNANGKIDRAALAAEMGGEHGTT